MSPQEPPNSQFGNNPLTVPPPGTPPGVVAPPITGTGTGAFTPLSPNAPNTYGGQKIAGANPSQADYGSVQGYADQAYKQARRNIDPIQEQQGRRMEQDLINKGIDPSSEQGKAMLDQQNRNFADQDSAASFGALQFGQGIQNQMSQQEQAQAELAGNMQQGLWNQELGRKGQDLQFQLGKMQNELGYSGLANDRYGTDVQQRLGEMGMQNQRYGMDLNQQLGMGQLDLGRNQAEHQQGMDWLNYDQNVWSMNQQNQMIQDALWNQMYGATPIPGMGGTNPTSPYNTYLGAGNTKYFETTGSGGMGAVG
jgi:hypothetical protein